MAGYKGPVAGLPCLDHHHVHLAAPHPSSCWVLDTRYRSKTKYYSKKAFLPPLCRQLGSKHQMSSSSAQVLSPCIRPSFSEAASLNLRASASFSTSPNLHPSKILLLNSSLFSAKTFRRQRETYFHKKFHKSWEVRAQVELAAGIDVINNLGLDTLTFLAATVLIVPAFKAINQSPILGFLLAGVVLNQLGLIRSVTDIKALSELGILFLLVMMPWLIVIEITEVSAALLFVFFHPRLFEMGLELSLVRLKALARFAFGMGLSQVFFSTLAFTAFELPPNGAIGTRVLEWLFHAKPDLVNIRTVDEAVVIGAALSLSSSAFVLQLLAEKGELPTRFGSATLGILLLQDIAVVPLLVILPILESGNIANANLWPVLAAESLKALLGLGVISLGGRLFLRRFFEIVADSRSSEAFVALCLLTVTGTSYLTQKLGFSDTLGAFLAGALLAETNYRTQVEADIRPFRGLLLGLFFVTTGTSIDLKLLLREWANVAALLAGLIAIKTAIITAIGPRVGLTLSESVRTGLLLSQGGEFAFVVFSLANRLGVLPLELNRLLIIVVVLSMALTPLLNEVGRKAAEYIETNFEDTSPAAEMQGVKNFEADEPVVIIGFGQMGQVLANFLSTPLAAGLGGDAAGWPYVAFDLDPGRVKAACKLGFPVLYGDGSRPVVLQTVGISKPKAVLVMYTGRQKSVQSVERIRNAFPHVPIYSRAQDLGHLLELKQAGTTDAILENAETSLQLGSKLLRGLGVMSDDVRFLRRMMRESMELRAQEAMDKKVSKDTDWLVPFQAKVRETWKSGRAKDDSVPRKEQPATEQAYWGDDTGSTLGDAYSIQNDERKLDEKLPLLFSGHKYPAKEVQISPTGVLNRAAVSGKDEAISSSAVAVAAPTGMIMEQDAQPGNADQLLDPQAEALTVTVCSSPSQTTAANILETQSTGSSQVQPTSLGIAKLKWRRRNVQEFENLRPEDLEDERGVTLCSLYDDDYRYENERENRDELERIDVTMAALKKEEANK